MFLNIYNLYTYNLYAYHRLVTVCRPAQIHGLCFECTALENYPAPIGRSDTSDPFQPERGSDSSLSKAISIPKMDSLPLLLTMWLSPAPRSKCLINGHGMTLNIASSQGKYFTAKEVQPWTYNHGTCGCCHIPLTQRQSAKYKDETACVSKNWNSWILKEKGSSKIETSLCHSQWPTCRICASPSYIIRLRQIRGLDSWEGMFPPGVLLYWRQRQPAKPHFTPHASGQMSKRRITVFLVIIEPDDWKVRNGYPTIRAGSLRNSQNPEVHWDFSLCFHAQL